MADEIVVNGGGAAAAADVDVEISSTVPDSDVTRNQTVEKLMQKLSILEQEKKQLIDDKELMAEKLKQLEDEIESSESDKRALSSIASRAAVLETEVSRLQHDLITSISDGQESNAELSELKQVVEELKKSESEKSEKIVVIDKERNLLLERLTESTDKLKDYETKMVWFESNQKVEEEVKTKIAEKDEQILILNRMIEEFQSEIVKNRAELEKSKKEKKDIEIGKNDLEGLLKKSERKVTEMGQELDQIQKKELEVNENSNGIVEEDGDVKRSNLKLDLPVIAVAAGAVTIVAFIYFRHAKF